MTAGSGTRGIRGLWLGLALLACGPIEAATLSADQVAGGFSGSYLAPTQVAAGYDVLSGTASAGQSVMLAFVGLPSGAQTLTFSFALPAGTPVQGPGNGWAYANGGGALLYSIGTPFAYSAWGGTTLGSFGVSNGSESALTDTLTLTLGPSFSGPLYLGFHFTYGSTVAYSISAPSNAGAVVPLPPVEPVPLPAAAVMFGSALAALGGAAVVRRRKPAAS